MFTLLARSCPAFLAVVLVAACGGTRPDGGATAAVAGATVNADWFVEQAQTAGLDFLHFNGMSGQLYYPEIMGPGVGLFDYDGDGDLDVYVVQGQMLGLTPASEATFPPNALVGDRLYRNDLASDRSGGHTVRFIDVSENAGIHVRSYGMGVAIGDFNNDGFPDLYRTSLSGGVMLRNNGNGTFTDVTKETGTENGGGWSVSAAFVDFDRDGFLDLFVGNYLVYNVETNLQCFSMSGRPDYCPPSSYHAQPDRLYRNRGDGTFSDVTTKALAGGADGPALGVSTADFNRDGWMDIYVANDGEPNQLWINQRDGTFKDAAPLGGAALSANGDAEASMGIDAGDFDNDGDEDLFITNWVSQMNVLYVNSGSGVFEDRRTASGLGRPSIARTGFGTAWLDYDNDTWLDLLVVNGGVATIEAQARANEPFPLKMPTQLYRNLGNGRFEDVSVRAGSAFAGSAVGRGAAFGDIDNDGDTDVVVGNASGPLHLLINHVGSRNHWVGLRVVGGRGRRDMLGARVEIIRTDGSTVWRRARSDGSYASASDPRVLVGLGPATQPVRVRVHWPGGRVEEWREVPIDRYTMLEEGTGQ